MSRTKTTHLFKDVIWTDDIHLASALVAGNHILDKKILDAKGKKPAWLFLSTQEALGDVSLFEQKTLFVNAHAMWRLAHEAAAKKSGDEK